MERPVRFGVTLPQIKRSGDEARRAATRFDALGFDSLFVCDHVYGVPLPNLPILEAWTQLSAVAAITERAKLGTLVTPPFFRNPAILAKQIATLDNGNTVEYGKCLLATGTSSPIFFVARFVVRESSG